MAHVSLSLPFTLKYGSSWSTNLRVKLWHAGYKSHEEAKDLVAIDSWGFVREVFIHATYDVPRQQDFPITICERTRWREILGEPVHDDHTLAIMPTGLVGGAKQPLMHGPWDKNPCV